MAQFFKSWNWKGIALLVLAGVFTVFFIRAIVSMGSPKDTSATDATPPDATEAVASAAAPAFTFRDGDGHPVNWELVTDAWAAEAGFEKRYTLTDEERLAVAQVVMAEAGGEPYAGMVAVAQCILQAAEDDGIRPDEVAIKYAYTKKRPEPTDKALEAVADVFDFGNVVSSEPIKYFYAPKWTESEWHESQVYVMTINGHRFFKEASQ